MLERNVKNRVLVQMLSVLDKKQLKAFYEYLRCSIFNSNPTLIRLLESLEAKALNNSDSHLSHENLLKGTGINVSIVDKLCSQLMGNLNQFVAIWARKNDKTTDFATTLDAWHRMGLKPELFEREYRKMKRRLKKDSYAQFDFVDELQLEHAYAKFKATQPRRDQVDLFELHHQVLDEFYFVSKLKYQCAAVNAGRIFGKGNSQNFFDEKQIESIKLPLIGQAYYAVYQLLNPAKFQEKDAREVFRFLEEECKPLPVEDLSDLYGFLLNSCIRVLPTGKKSIEQLVNQIYDACLKHGLFTTNGTIGSGHFKNILSLKFRIGAHHEARNFIDVYGKMLPASEQELLLAYAHGLLAFHSGEYRKAIQIFRDIAYNSQEDLYWNLEARNMLWRSYFEAFELLSSEEHTEMIKLYDSFRLFVARSTQISEHKRKGYLNFIRYFNRLIQIGDKSLWASTAEELQTLYDETAQIEHLVNKAWLLTAIQRKIAQKGKS